MVATFEKRLRSVSARNRLGKNGNSNSFNHMDLRNKLNFTIKNNDARTIIRNRFRQRNVPVRDARSLINRKNPNFNQTKKNVPFIIPKRTVKNELYGRLLFLQNNNRMQQRKPRNIRQKGSGAIPDFSNMQIPNSLNFLRNSVQSGLFSNLIPFGNLENNLTPSGSKLSPIQGYRLEISNLQSSVTLDDVYELFSSIGSLRLCTITRPGQANVVFNEPSDALRAVERYNGRELDHRPMHITLVTPIANDKTNMTNSHLTSSMYSRINSPRDQNHNTKATVKQLIRNSQNRPTTKVPMEIDVDVVRKALFNVSSVLPPSKGNSAVRVQPRRSVDFNVSLS